MFHFQFRLNAVKDLPAISQCDFQHIGVFGARNKKRSQITAMTSPKKLKVKKKVYRTQWGELLKYVFKPEVNNCDH